VGYFTRDDLNTIKTWSMEGRAWGIMDSEIDLMPRKKKIEQWIFSAYRKDETYVSEGVRHYSTRDDAESDLIMWRNRGYTCSEIVQAPVLEVEE
jgi:hypothetical protein